MGPITVQKAFEMLEEDLKPREERVEDLIKKPHHPGAIRRPRSAPLPVRQPLPAPGRPHDQLRRDGGAAEGLEDVDLLRRRQEDEGAGDEAAAREGTSSLTGTMAP